MLMGLLSGLGVLAALALILSSGSMNYLFMRSQGRTLLEGEILGVVSVAGDVMKALLPIFLGWAMHANRRLYVGLGWMLFAVCTAVSFTSCLGFMAANRSEVDAVTVEAQRRAGRLSELEVQLKSRLKSLPAHRPLAVIDEELSAMRTDRRWASSKGCAEATAQSSRRYCDGYFKLRSERGSAEEAARLEMRLNSARAHLDLMGQDDGTRHADPQGKAIGNVFGVEVVVVRRFLLTLITVLVELGSAIGLYIATSHGFGEASRLRNSLPAIPRGLGQRVLVSRLRRKD